MHFSSSASATYSHQPPNLPGFHSSGPPHVIPGRGDEFIDVNNPKHPCYSGHQHIWRQDEKQWRCTRCGNPDMTGRPAPVLPNTPYPTPFVPRVPQPYMEPWPPTYPMTPGRIDVTYTKDTVGSGCLWDQLSPEDRGRPMGLSCPCPRCSPRC